MHVREITMEFMPPLSPASKQEGNQSIQVRIETTTGVTGWLEFSCDSVAEAIASAFRSVKAIATDALEESVAS